MSSILKDKEVNATIFENKDELIFYRLNDFPNLQNQNVNVSGTLINKITKHVRQKINSDMAVFKDVYFVKYLQNQQDFMPEYINKNEEDLLVFMIQLSSMTAQYLIDGEIITLYKNNGILIDPKKQNCKVVNLDDEDQHINVLFFNFLIKDRD